MSYPHLSTDTNGGILFISSTSPAPSLGKNKQSGFMDLILTKKF